MIAYAHAPSVAWWRHQMETFSALLALCAWNSPVPVKSPHKGQWRGALMFSLICAWINNWVNNREAGDLRRHRGHYDVNAMASEAIIGHVIHCCRVNRMSYKEWCKIQIYFRVFGMKKNKHGKDWTKSFRIEITGAEFTHLITAAEPFYQHLTPLSTRLVCYFKSVLKCW